MAYELSLPPNWKIWPVLHVLNLKRFAQPNESVWEDQPLPPILVDGEEECKVKGILWHKGDGSWHRYLVLWKGCPLTEAPWEPESHLKHGPQILEDYLHRVSTLQQRTWTKEAQRTWGVVLRSDHGPTNVYLGWNIVLGCFHVGVNRVLCAQQGRKTYSLL